MSWNIVINQQPFSPVSDNVTSEAKIKDQKRIERACRGWVNYMKKLKEKFLKDSQLVQMTLKEFIDYFQQDLNNSASILIAIEETIRIMKEEHDNGIIMSIKMI